MLGTPWIVTLFAFFLFFPTISSFWSDLVPLRSLDSLCLMGVTSHTPLLAGSAVLPVPDAALRPLFYLQLWSLCSPVLCHPQGPVSSEFYYPSLTTPFVLSPPHPG